MTNPPLVTTAPRRTTTRMGVAVGNEVAKGLGHGWAERKQIALETAMFVAFFLLLAALVGQGEAIAAGTFTWSFEPQPTAWLLVGFAAFTFHYLQTQKLFWRLLGEIQTGTLDQVYLSPLPSWVVAAAGRVAATVVETAVVVAVLYAGVRLIVDVPVHGAVDALVPLAALVVASVGYSLAIGGLTLRYKRLEVANDGLHMVVLFFGGVLVPLTQLPAWMGAVGRLLPVTHPVEGLRTTLIAGDGLSLAGDGGLAWLVTTAVGWLAAGAVAFHLGGTFARRNGTLTRY